MIKNLYIFSILFFSTLGCTEEKKIAKLDKEDIEYNKRVEKSCVRINKVHNYYLKKLNNINIIDKEIRILIAKQNRMTKAFLFKYDCYKFNLIRYGTVTRPYKITYVNINKHKSIMRIIQDEKETLK